jgi:Fe-S-cluster containining protein
MDDVDMTQGTSPPLETLPDAREARELGAQENADLCRGCVACCSYITIEVDPPRAAWEYDQWIWALHHRGISLYVERPERWFVHVETTCRQLGADGRCGIYGRHPVLCRDYDPRSCERRLPLSDTRAWFSDAEQLETWLRKERPGHWMRLDAYRRTAALGAETAPLLVSSGAFIPLPALLARGAR